MNLDEVAYCEIHPRIGIARVGDSPSGLFIGPEAPGLPARAEGGFKDATGRVKRQAARFRVYGYRADRTIVGELTSAELITAEATVTWTAELANTKAEWYKFRGRHTNWQVPGNRRNLAVTDRATLMIRPGPRTIAGRDQGGTLQHRFDGGNFLGTPVPLGELRTDPDGRLLVLGGAGTSASVIPDNPLTSYANNDNWYDDVSDGPVTATVQLGDRTLTAAGAWVIVAPPDFSPDTTNIVTLYDVALEMARTSGGLQTPPEVSFTRDVYPLLARMCDHRWVSATALRGHGEGEQGDFLLPRNLERLSSAAAGDAPVRRAVFDRLRTPGAEDVTQANYTFMPPLGGDAGDPRHGEPRRWFTLRASQYECLRRWAEGDFVADWAGQPTPPVPFEQIPLEEQPHALVRAALQAAAGGAWFPGIEMSFPADLPETWAAPFTLAADMAPGDVTKYMALPWQADFYECRTHWWPAQRPDDVLPEPAYLALIGLGNDGTDAPLLPTYRLPWDRGVADSVAHDPDGDAGKNEMVDKWRKLGFVVARRDLWDRRLLVETERGAQVGYSDREWLYMLQHPDLYPQQALAARDHAQLIFDATAVLQRDPTLYELYRPFPYTRETVDARLEDIYTDLVQYAENYDPAQDRVCRSRADVVERIRQFAPFNLLDGVWLRNMTPAGPIDLVHGALFQIWNDEIGGGDPALNHANLYESLLHSVGIYLPPVDSHEFSTLPDMLDAAYSVPAFQLAVSQHSEHFFPELLGMTLHLEWEVVGINAPADLLDHYGIDTHFYRMHIGIDNATTGHGALARDAVHHHLDQVYSRGGEAAVQEQWRRIWTGYVAFGTYGSLGEALAAKLRRPPSARDRMATMIMSKAHYAALNHDGKKLGDVYLNDWFSDPYGLLDTLAKSDLIVAGDPEHSPFFERTAYTGPMYKVFDEDELALWKEWVRSLTPIRPGPGPQPLEAMLALVDALRLRQTNSAPHATITLVGPDPQGGGGQVTQPIAWWFRQPSISLLAALADPGNGLVTPGHPESSKFVTDLLTPDRPMGRAFRNLVAGTGRTGLDIATAWIAAGCPLAAALPAGARRAELARAHGPDPTSRQWLPVRGMGAVH